MYAFILYILHILLSVYRAKILPKMVSSKKMCAFFVVLVLCLMVPGPSMTGVEAMHLGGGGGGGMRGLEYLLAAGLLAKILRQHHHHGHHHHHG
ncbi:hypothetical protein NPIL_658671 [Nephila pilipes]|uniref:Uncharacterized protein n=1 Tax=Nephila pilipes TaxID=299642 RepID=A0A8X6MBI5_NEPPI|nr:hypothetical protein NPIL_658671 [Nephila pilipes]